MTAMAFPLGVPVTHGGSDVVTDDFGPIYSVLDAPLCCPACRETHQARLTMTDPWTYAAVCGECQDALAVWR